MQATITAIWFIAIIGILALVGSFIKMESGFSSNNLRVITIIVAATFAALLALV